MKLLSIIIPTYNMQDFLRRCLNSLIFDEKEFENLEVLVVNDGSKDSSSAIAHEYEDAYPHVFRVIDKSNGNYGSCINRGLKEASGKYIKILDADDYYVTESLQILIRALQILSVNVDVIYTGYQVVHADGEKSRVFLSDNLDFGMVKDLHHYSLPDLTYDNYTMHSLAYSTDFLRKIGYYQQEGISYTDSEYVYYPITVARSFIAYQIILYCYYVGRAGQTVSIESMIKNRNSYTKLVERFVDDKRFTKGNINALTFRRNILSLIVQDMIKIYIKYSKYDKEREGMLRHVLQLIKKQDSELFNKIIYKRVKFLYPYKAWYILGKYWFLVYNLPKVLRQKY